jgi:hypothetical protein
MGITFDSGLEITIQILESYLAMPHRRGIGVTGEFPIEGPADLTEEAFRQIKLRLEAKYPWIQLSLTDRGRISCFGFAP